MIENFRLWYILYTLIMFSYMSFLQERYIFIKIMNDLLTQD